MIEKCQVKILSNRVVCDTPIKDGAKRVEKVDNDFVKNKKKYIHLVEIGMDLNKYHPTIIRTMIDGGRNFKIPEQLKHQLATFAHEAFQKGFNPSLFGYNTTLHKFIKTVNNIPKRKYNMKGKGASAQVIAPPTDAEASSEEDEEEETDIDAILSEVESDLENNRMGEVKAKIKKYKHKIPTQYYNTIMKSIK
jgi:hypothetical protein